MKAENAVLTALKEGLELAKGQLKWNAEQVETYKQWLVKHEDAVDNATRAIAELEAEILKHERSDKRTKNSV